MILGYLNFHFYIWYTFFRNQVLCCCSTGAKRWNQIFERWNRRISYCGFHQGTWIWDVSHRRWRFEWRHPWLAGKTEFLILFPERVVVNPLIRKRVRLKKPVMCPSELSNDVKSNFKILNIYRVHVFYKNKPY